MTGKQIIFFIKKNNLFYSFSRHIVVRIQRNYNHSFAASKNRMTNLFIKGTVKQCLEFCSCFYNSVLIEKRSVKLQVKKSQKLEKEQFESFKKQPRLSSWTDRRLRHFINKKTWNLLDNYF